MTEGTAGLEGRRVALFESRLAAEFANLVRKHGGDPWLAPSLVEAELTLGEEIREFVRLLRAGQVDVLCVLTGVGQRKLVELLRPLLPRDELVALLSRIVVAARGSKSVLALRELGLRPQVIAPEPHTWQELLEALQSYLPLAGKCVALQQYGAPHERLTQGLTGAGARVLQLPVYRWQLPADCAPLSRVVRGICNGDIDVILFTAGPQAGALLEIARREGVEASLRQALARVAIGSVGPSCTETLSGLGFEPDFEPEHGKMGQLVREAVRRVELVLQRKRGTSSTPTGASLGEP
jgi:uroporphyrinogen-III synthase